MKTLLANGIVPNGIFHSDSTSNTQNQFDMEYPILSTLYFLSTSYHKVVDQFKGDKRIIFQKGYKFAKESEN